MGIAIGEEVVVQIPGSSTLVICRVIARYEFKGVWWLVVVEPQTKTQLRYPELKFLKPDKPGPKLSNPGPG